MKSAVGIGLRRLFPQEFDNRFPGRRPALWTFGALLFLKLVMSTNSIVNTAEVAHGADGFRLDSYGADGARAVLMLFATTSLGQLALAVMGLIALVRYRSMVPFLFLLFLVEQVARRFIVQGYAIERTGNGSTGFYVNLALLMLLVGGLLLSLWPRRAAS